MKRLKGLGNASAFLCFIFIFSALFTGSASANSARTHWVGTTATGSVVAEENCPVTVEKEVLTFDVQEFPQGYYANEEDYLAYTGKVSAQYTFHNPADYSVSARLLFPFGTSPDYDLSGSFEENYNVTVNDTDVEKKLRHSFSYWGEQFELERDIARLHDGFMTDGFFTPDTTVTRYTFRPSVDLEKYPHASASFMLSSDPVKTRVLMEKQNGGRLTEEAMQMYYRATQGEVTVNVIGELPEQGIQWKFYEDAACEKEIAGSMGLIKTENISLREFALSQYYADSDVSEQDWYNAVIEAMKYFEMGFGAVSATEFRLDVSDWLMLWYDYELDFKPGETLINTVTAPLYPSIDAGYEPPVYEFKYLLSPARTWAEFGNLDIEVNTPFYMLESSPESFEYNNPGYSLHLEALPEGELNFTLCAEAEPENTRGNSFLSSVLLFVAILIVAVIIPAVIIILLIIFIIRLIRKRWSKG